MLNTWFLNTCTCLIKCAVMHKSLGIALTTKFLNQLDLFSNSQAFTCLCLPLYPGIVIGARVSEPHTIELNCNFSYMWQSLVEIEHYSYLIALRRSKHYRTSVKGGAHMHWVNTWILATFTQCLWALPLTKVLRCCSLSMVTWSKYETE